MTFRIEHNEGMFFCDSCPEHIECDGRSDFKGAHIFAKSKGWRTYIGPDKEWAAACPLCVEQHAEDQRRK
jgi:hypothetical protein